MAILIIDNYDSFTFNLVQLVHRAREHAPSIIVRRNDDILLDEIESLNPSHIIISPGPGSPKESGISPMVVEAFYRTIPILGVCLGHQVICELFGAVITRAPEPVHGKTHFVHHNQKGCFKGIPSPVQVGRYHSLIAQGPMLDCLEISATEGGIIMGVSHRDAPLNGVQFHPESFLTTHGETMLENFLSL